jgi:putative peptide zinc metalloprotease protein
VSQGNGDFEGTASLWHDDGPPVPLRGPGAAEELAERAPSNGDGAPARPTHTMVTASDFSAERMLRSAAEAPVRGWRRAVYRLTGGLVHVGPSAADIRYRELVAAAKAPIHGCRKVAFISRKGGVGKTTTCLLAGHTFASLRGDRVIALDGNPDAGTLGHRIRRETSATVSSLLDDVERISRYADIRGYTSQAASRLEVVAADDDPRITQALGEPEFRRAIELLEHHYNLLCLDTGTGVLESAARGILGAADQVVVVSAPSLDGARAASSTLDWLDQNGYDHLVRGAVAVLNTVRSSDGAVDLDRVEQHFDVRCRACVRIPWDPHLETGAEATLDRLRTDTRDAYLELAAAIAVGFDATTEGGSDPCPS